ncbi:oligoendopeptidase F [Sulfoacidibacillus ferrooxidans]|uniref:Oligopeptidase F n=1 Tax=Sulfoacidibacillus ferrooxidans TaxID=2005001 RepID=A0A9X2ACQ1_9BACL|nr:oligoendopeptidase F [Sulfoacidibacillus ferrooxidans]MCI0182575.1 Oligoendopeptidase F, plasmid [Sulfoacidibacillus ferrooxidans]
MDDLRERDQIETQYKWATEALFETNDAWEEEYKAIRKSVEEDPFASYRGHLHEGPERLLQYFQTAESLGERLGKLQIYAHILADQDTRTSFYQAMQSRIQMLGAEFAQKDSFFEPELLSLPVDQLDGYVHDEKLRDYQHVLDNLIRNKPHVLSDETEEALASLHDVLGSSGQVFSQLTNADFQHGAFTVDGKEYIVTEGRLGLLLRDTHRTVRKLAYEHVYDTYLHHKNAIGSLYANSVKADVRMARVRKFSTAREMALFSNHIPTTVYDALIKGVRDNIGHQHRYIELRRKVLSLDHVRLYDKYVPLAESSFDEYSFEQGFSLVQEGLRALGDEYQEILKKAVDDRWIDVFETPGKRSGAYSTGFYATRPYVLLNYQGNYNSVSTLAHELGHSAHTYLAGKTQLPQYSHYSIFLAEIASTVNETLLVNHLLDMTKDPLARATLINQQLDNLGATIYRQTMFAEFEQNAHRVVEEGQALTHDSLSEMYSTLNTFYHGSAYAEDERSTAEWSRIPHFYRAFYVYQYATGMSAALVFADRIRKQGESAAQKYLGFLRSGSKDYPLAVLNEAGLDMTDPQVVTQALTIFGQLVDELEELLTKVK